MNNIQTSTSRVYTILIFAFLLISFAGRLGATYCTALDLSASCDLGIAIPDNACGEGNTFPITINDVPGTRLGSDVYLQSVRLIIAHPWLEDVEISLLSPAGIAVPLSIANGEGGTNYGNPSDCDQYTEFSMTASTSIKDPSVMAPYIGQYLPEGDFATFNNNGEDPNDIWTLQVCDNFEDDIGTLEFVELVFAPITTLPSCASLTHPIDGTIFPFVRPTLEWLSETDVAGYTLRIGTTLGGSEVLPETDLGLTTSYDHPTSFPIGNIHVTLTAYNAVGGISCGSELFTISTDPSSCNYQVPIPDNSCEANDFEFLVNNAPGTRLGTDVYLESVQLIIEHPYVSDLTVSLKSPDGNAVNLSIENGDDGNNYGDPEDCTLFTEFTMSATTSISDATATTPFIGQYLPEGDFADFNANQANPNGTWTIQVCDAFEEDEGTVEYVRLVFGPLSECADDIVLISPDDDHISGSIIHEETDEAIIATNKVMAGSRTDYDAREHILMASGFEVEQGAVFHAYIDGCLNP